VIAFAIAATARPAGAACRNGETIAEGHSCRLHLVNGPVLAPSRILGLAGAYQGLAEGLDGYAANAAAPAVRVPWSWKWFDYDLDASISIPNPFRRLDDLEYDGVKDDFDYSGYVFVTAGANLQFGPWGFGVSADLSRFELAAAEQTNEEAYLALLIRTRVLVARTLLDGDLVIGGGFRYIGFDISGATATGASTRVVSVAGFAPELGFLLKPEAQSYRFGATFRAPVSTGNLGPDDAPKVDRWYVPRSVDLPWELDVGIAFQGGPRPLNVSWSDPHEEADRFRDEIAHARARRAAERARILAGTPGELREQRADALAAAETKLREAEEAELASFSRHLSAQRRERFRGLPRDYLLFTLGLLVTGPTTDGISLESFFTQTIKRAGQVVTYSPRAGVETELVPGAFRPRIGTYIEPSRFTEGSDWRAFRQHVTAGFDLYLFPWRVFGLFEEGTKWRVTTAIDVSANYWNYGLSIGVWN
jgi:hypothetical protein